MAHVHALLLGLQTLLTVQVEGEAPVRFGVPLPAASLARGLHIEGEAGACLQWAPLQEQPGLDSDRLWVELCLSGAAGTVRIAAGGNGPERDDGAVCTVATTLEVGEASEEQRVVRTWREGASDRWHRTVWLVGDPQLGISEGEASTVVDQTWIERRTRVRVPAGFWRQAGVLPRASGSSEAALREQLLGLLPRLPPAPGQRGRGDYLRGDGIVTNLEFDTILGLVRLGLAEHSSAALERAFCSARHLVDRDLEARSGLPCRHGSDHRRARPEPGHVWVRGLTLVGATYAERDLLDAARSIVRSLAARVRAEPVREGRDDRMRDEAWPLWELEEYLRFENVGPVREAANAVASRMIGRYDAELGVLRYGENQTRGPSVKERVWLSVGIAVPALRRYADRTGDDRAARIADAIEARACRLLQAGPSGLPLQCMVSPRGVFGTVRVRGAAEGFLLLDGLGTRTRQRIAGRVRDALQGALDPAADDLATRWTLAARCDWVMR